MSEKALEFENVSFSYGNKEILKGVDLSIKKGEFVSLIGASGSGKSTIFRLITGLEKVDSGVIQLNGEMRENRHGKVGYMPQRDLLMPWRTVYENVRLPLELNRTEIHSDEITEMLDAFGLDGYAKKYPGELSGGMRQRVSFLRATLAGSELLLLDEPFSALDALTKLFMQEWLLERWERDKKTVLFITHDISEAVFLSDRILVLEETPAKMLTEIEVPLDRPRRRKDEDLPAVLHLKESLIERFRKQALK
ncbi:ABC transporter ATP-binding protein [Aciduricibacillus chroicocephali]|uniref:ABC transporter ATP-binding protein n=1 Tax=Aciduricibacillus chroicocephali TaxID=3054939 RepID=A0ABY9KTS5_9BACI|nr:ABC transporter ATP-binding protein [Bacillaceae bacterium 44XB]